MKAANTALSMFLSAPLPTSPPTPVPWEQAVLTGEEAMGRAMGI